MEAYTRDRESHHKGGTGKKPFLILLSSGDFNMTVTKERLIEAVNNNAGQSKKKAISMVKSLFEIMKSTLESGEAILISGFGKFCVKAKKQRKGRNPSTGNDITLGARRVVIFRCSSVLKNGLNGKK
jgi:integration host factor subunit alpha